MWDDALDRAIDDVARAMTAGEPHGDLRARVMARVEANAPRGARRVQSRRWRAALAAAALALIVVIAYRETKPMIRLDPEATTATHTPPVQLNPDTTTVARGPRPSGPAMTSRAGSGTTPPKRIAIPPSPLDALAPAPLAVSPITASDLDTPSIDLPPLDTIPPMAIAPLGDEGDRR